MQHKIHCTEAKTNITTVVKLQFVLVGLVVIKYLID